MRNAFLNRTVQYPNNRLVLFAIAFICLACCGILIFLQPFGVNNYDPSESLSYQLVVGVSMFGLTMFFANMLNELLLRPNVISQYTIKSVSLWLIWCTILGGSVSYLTYNILGNWHDWSLPGYVDFVKNWVLLTMLPLALVILYFRQHALKQELQEASINSEDADQLFIFTADNQKDRIALPVHNILYLESQDNYVELCYMQGDDVRRHLLRSTLKRMEEELADTPVVRCHRSYLVNVENVMSFKGNAHKLELTLKGMKKTIPVSRRFTDEMMSILEE